MIYKRKKESRFLKSFDIVQIDQIDQIQIRLSVSATEKVSRNIN